MDWPGTRLFDARRPARGDLDRARERPRVMHAGAVPWATMITAFCRLRRWAGRVVDGHRRAPLPYQRRPDLAALHLRRRRADYAGFVDILVVGERTWVATDYQGYFCSIPGLAVAQPVGSGHLCAQWVLSHGDGALWIVSIGSATRIDQPKQHLDPSSTRLERGSFPECEKGKLSIATSAQNAASRTGFRAPSRPARRIRYSDTRALDRPTS